MLPGKVNKILTIDGGAQRVNTRRASTLFSMDSAQALADMVKECADRLCLAAARRMWPFGRSPAVNVEMHPALRLADETLEEEGRSDRTRHAAGRRVGEIGEFGADILFVAGIERQAPQRIVRFQARFGQVMRQISVIGEEGREIRPRATRAAPVSVAMSIKSSGSSSSA